MRAALFYRGQLLLLEKDGTSRIPGSLEFPGGKIDAQVGDIPTLEEQERALITEVVEETGIDIAGLHLEKVDTFNMLFEDMVGRSKNVRRSRVRLFLVRIPDAVELSIVVNQTKNAHGEPEDKHVGYRWVTPEELAKLAVSMIDNVHTKKRTRPLPRNTRHVRELLAVLKKEHLPVSGD